MGGHISNQFNYAPEGTRGLIYKEHSTMCTSRTHRAALTKTEASTTRRFATPLTLNAGSTTPSAVPNRDMAAVDVGCCDVWLY